MASGVGGRGGVLRGDPPTPTPDLSMYNTVVLIHKQPEPVQTTGRFPFLRQQEDLIAGHTGDPAAI